MNYRITQMPALMYRLGISYHAFGQLSKGAVKVYDYYKVDKITNEQLEELKKVNPDITLYFASPVFAPEIRDVMVCFPKAGFYKLVNGKTRIESVKLVSK